VLRKLNCYIIKIWEVFIMRMFRQRVEKIMKGESVFKLKKRNSKGR